MKYMGCRQKPEFILSDKSESGNLECSLQASFSLSDNKNKVINKNFKINKNPFENNKYILQEINGNVVSQNKKKYNMSLDLLKKTNKHFGDEKKCQEINMSQMSMKVKLFTPNNIIFNDLEYFTYPQLQNIKSDGSYLYEVVEKTFFDALKSAYTNYKNDQTIFYVNFQKFLFCFNKEGIQIKQSSNDISSCKSLKNTLKQWDINFIYEKETHQIIIDDNTNLVVDLIGNYLTKIEIPFILSYRKFNYSIFRQTSIKFKDAILRDNILQYYYESNGIVFFGDRKFYVDLISSETKNRLILKPNIAINYFS